MVSKELREKAVLGANILKDGSDPQILPDRFFFLPFFLARFFLKGRFPLQIHSCIRKQHALQIMHKDKTIYED